MSKPEFVIDDTTAHCYCEDDQQAAELQEEIGSICGAMVERDGNFIYAPIDEQQAEEADRELRDHGYIPTWL